MFILMIGPLVFVHEMGHYLMGRLFGTKAESFSIGFGRQIAGWTDRRGTVWRLSALPLGGYVKFAGDANTAGAGSEGLDEIPVAQRHRYFAFKPIWQRALIVAAGPVINFLFAIVIFAGFFFVEGQPVLPPVVGEVLEDSAAADVGLEVGDRIVLLDGDAVDDFSVVQQTIVQNPGTPVELGLIRDGTQRVVTLTPRVVETEDPFGNVARLGRLGVLAAGQPEVRPVGALESVALGVRQTWRTIGSITDVLGQLLTGRRSVEDLSGPLKIGQLSGQVGTLGPPAFIWLMAFISINLGFINLLPIPMLDGGHLALFAAEAARGGRPLPERFQEIAFMAGFVLVISFMLLVTFNDLASFGLWGHVRAMITG
ncbi:MAG: RIP metalloprotease RseP [Pseudomonadota bacterium]